jgi:hypothetical protein
LQKDPIRRMTIKQVLEHPWILKYDKAKLPEKRRNSRDASQFIIYTTTENDK